MILAQLELTHPVWTHSSLSHLVPPLSTVIDNGAAAKIDCPLGLQR